MPIYTDQLSLPGMRTVSYSSACASSDIKETKLMSVLKLTFSLPNFRRHLSSVFLFIIIIIIIIINILTNYRLEQRLYVTLKD